MSKAILLNDTSEWYHYGCQLTSMGLRSLISERFDLIDRVPIQELNGIPCKLIPVDAFSFENLDPFIEANADLFSRIEAADTIILNGEGSLHGWNAFVQRVFYIIKAATTRFTKNVYIVNHSAFPYDSTDISDSKLEDLYRDVYSLASFVAAREAFSLEILHNLGVPCEQSFDCSVLSISRTTYDLSDLVVFGGAATFGEFHPEVFVALRSAFAERQIDCCLLIGAAAHPAKDDLRLVEAIRQLDSRFPVLEVYSSHDFINTIGRARLHISGRFHYTIAAHAVGTPSITLQSNTPKNEALSSALGIPPPLRWDNPDLISSIIERADIMSSQGIAGPTLTQLQQWARRNLPDGELHGME